MRRRFLNDWFCGKFKGLGYRMTQARDEILEILKKEKHLSASDIYLNLQKNNPNIGIATIYRTLNLLVNIGILSKMDFGDGKGRYEISSAITREEHHHHLVCEKCGRIIEYSDFMEEERKFLKNLQKKLSEKFNFEIKNHLINFYGLCNSCKILKKGGEKDVLW